MPEDCQNGRNMYLVLTGQIKLNMCDGYICVSFSMIHRNGVVYKNKKCLCNIILNC